MSSATGHDPKRNLEERFSDSVFGVPKTDIGTVRVVVIHAYPQDGTRIEREANTSALEALERLERLVEDYESLKKEHRMISAALNAAKMREGRDA